MQVLTTLIQAVCVLIAAGILGNWYLKEAQRIKKTSKPWYAVYFSAPGLLTIALLLLLPLAIYLRK